MKKDTIVIGTRSSKLALWQAEYVKGRLEEEYPGLKVELKLMTTKGDKILDAPLAKIGGKGLFTKELEMDMLSGGIDLAVHSLKDMPTELPEGLTLAAITKRFDPGDAVVSLRGKVNTRLAKLESENFDAIILAVAGLKRLGFGERITEVLPRDMVLPAVGQGALAIETREDDADMREMLAFLNDEATVHCAKAERAFLGRVEGGCQVPVGVYAVPADNGEIQVEAVIASLDGQRLYRDKISGKAGEAEKLGVTLAEKLLAAGGQEILQELGLLQNK